MYEAITKDSYFDILTEIAEFLGCNLNTRKQISTFPPPPPAALG